MGDTTEAGARCVQCSALVRPGAPWCTQCYAPTSAAGASTAVPAPAGGVRLAERPLAAPSTRPTTGAWPCTACSTSNDLALAACDACGTPFLAAARDARPTLVLPVVGDLLALTPARRVGLAVCVAVAFVLISGLLALLLA